MNNPIHPAESGEIKVASTAEEVGKQRYWGVIVESVDTMNETYDRIAPKAPKAPEGIRVMTDMGQAPQDVVPLSKSEHENQAAIDAAYIALVAAQDMTPPESFDDLKAK